MDACTIGLRRAKSIHCHQHIFTNETGFQNWDTFTEEEKELILRRAELEDVKEPVICLHHKAYFLDYYSAFQKMCCDPFAFHRIPARNALKVCSLEQSRELKFYSGRKIIPGKKFCRNCERKLNQEVEENKEKKFNSSDREIIAVQPTDEVKYGKEMVDIQLLAEDQKEMLHIELIPEDPNEMFYIEPDCEIEEKMDKGLEDPSVVFGSNDEQYILPESPTILSERTEIQVAVKSELDNLTVKIEPNVESFYESNVNEITMDFKAEPEITEDYKPLLYSSAPGSSTFPILNQDISEQMKISHIVSLTSNDKPKMPEKKSSKDATAGASTAKTATTLSYVCPTCDKECISAQQFRLHKWTHEDYPYRCTVCSRKFGLWNEFGNHTYKHIGDYAFCCELCCLSCPSMKVFQRHVSKIHSDATMENHPIPLMVEKHKVPSRFKTKTNCIYLSQKVRVQTQDNHVCAFCNKLVASYEELQFHMYKHKSEAIRGFCCEPCVMTFRNLILLKIHMRRHD